jgi:ParB-like chromosome segregation protein Spo0J
MERPLSLNKNPLIKVEKNIEIVEINKIKLWKDNPRKNDKAVPLLAEVIKERGQVTPIVVYRKNNVCYKGNTTIKALKYLGIKHIRVLYADFPSEAAAISYGIADNRSSEWAEWDSEILKNFLSMPEVINDSGFSLKEQQAIFFDTCNTLSVNTVDPRDKLINPDVLKPNKNTYRVHPKDQIDHLKKSIELYGIYKPILIANDNTILDGHALVTAALQLNIPMVPIKRLNIKADSDEALKLITSINEIGRFAEVDDRKLTNYLKEIKDKGTKGLEGTGYDKMMLANLLMVTRSAKEIKDINAAAEWVGMPEYHDEITEYKLTINFLNQNDKIILLNRLGFSDLKNKEIKSIWWPRKKMDDSKSVRFE